MKRWKDTQVEACRCVCVCLCACVRVCVCVLDLRRCCLCVSVDPRWSQNSTEHISPLGVFTHTFRHTQIFSVNSPDSRITWASARSAAARFLLHWNSQMNSYGGPERPVIAPSVISPLLHRTEREEKKKQLPSWDGVFCRKWRSWGFGLVWGRSCGRKETRERWDEEGKDFYAPLDPSILKLQLQISDLDSSALQLVPIQHIYIFCSSPGARLYLWEGQERRYFSCFL